MDTGIFETLFSIVSDETSVIVKKGALIFAIIIGYQLYNVPV